LAPPSAAAPPGSPAAATSRTSGASGTTAKESRTEPSTKKAPDQKPHRRKKPKASVQGGAAAPGSKFDPSGYLKKEATEEDPVQNPAASDKSKKSLVDGRRGIVCKPVEKPSRPCEGPECDTVGVATDQEIAAAETEPLINDSARLTKELTKAVRENCAPIEDEGPKVKPVLEIELKDPPADGDGRREVVPKVGVTASF
jgi:hypothetical protein